ncbi:unnamed protein product [Staurois parvus]|uniref:Uncharacterized protein n=1 Tax=Staurois parvus TaxID=386267 RepID=A0ABN9AP02_9NEOB|nr:unnamed protein product [Staurois parvus]
MSVTGVPAGVSPPTPRDLRAKLTGKRPMCKQHRSLSCQQGHAALYFSAQQRNTK